MPLPPIPSIPPPGRYFIQQQSNDRFMDAYQSNENDFAVVTRSEQSNQTQVWRVLVVVGGVYTIQEQINFRFVDAYQSDENDFALVTRPEQVDDPTQRWILTPLGNDTYTIQQQSNGRFVDAYQSDENDFALVTRRQQVDDPTQRWIVVKDPTSIEGTSDLYIIYQRSNFQFMDASPVLPGFALATRAIPNNVTSKWILSPIGAVCTFSQQSSSRFMDAYQSDAHNFAVVTRPEQVDDATQRWILTPLGNDIYTIQQQSNNRFVDAYQSGVNDSAVVTRTRQENDRQRWRFTLISEF